MTEVDEAQSVVVQDAAGRKKPRGWNMLDGNADGVTGNPLAATNAGEARKSSMNDPPLDNTVRARMQGIRCDIDQGLEDVSASARNMVDWKHYVKTYPWVCLGTAAVLGFLIVPKRSTPHSAGSATPTEPVQASPPVVSSAPGAARGMVDALVATVVSIAVREATAFLGQSAGRLLGITRPQGTNHHDSNSTS
jgi:hypothetical protein